MLDEPTNGLDPAGIVEIRTLLKSLADGRRTVVVSSHLLGEIQAMVDYVVVIRFGELLYSGTLEGLMEQASERVVAAPERDGSATFDRRCRIEWLAVRDKRRRRSGH